MIIFMKAGYFQCLRCKYAWLPRIAGTPKQCPYCKSPKWNIPRPGEVVGTPIGPAKVTTKELLAVRQGPVDDEEEDPGIDKNFDFGA